MQKNRFTLFISILMAGLTLAVGGVGIYTYRKLDKVVDQLKHDSGPNFNLIILKDIMVSISGIENDMEAYLLTDNQTYINRYDQRIGDVKQYLDSLQRMNHEDLDFQRYTDSLNSLIDKKVNILNQFQQSVSYNLDGTINEFAKKLDQISIETTNPDHKNKIDTGVQDSVRTILEDTIRETSKKGKDKKGFLRNIFGSISLFSKDKTQQDSVVVQEAKEQVSKVPDQSNNFRSDSAFISQKTREYRSILQNELYKLRRKSSIISEDIKQQELELAQNQQTIQNQIIDLLTYLEEREIAKIKIKNYNAQLIADETNDQVTIFSILTTILLIVTIIVMWSYFQKNKAYQKILRKATNDAKKLAKAKEQFLANMSHEIRTPMNAISGFTQQLLKTDLSYNQKEQLDIIHQSSDHLLHLLNDVLDFSKLQAEKLKLEKSDFNLLRLIEDTVKLMRQKADEKHLVLSFDCGEIPEYVNGDPYRLRQVLINLISNSIKFTEMGEVSVSITSLRKSKGRCTVELIVKDTGIGIPKDQHERIMMEFEQVGNHSDHKGTGLGLAITKKIVSLHKGKMKLKSASGEGTEITITIPYEVVDKPALEESIAKPLKSLKGMRILIADDEPYNLKLLATILKNKEVKWVECSDGTGALSGLVAEKFDIALLDIKMPGLTGYEVADQLRKSHSFNAKIPLIALTATVTKEEFDKCIKSGFNQVIRKPFKEQELIDAISQDVSKEWANNSTNQEKKASKVSHSGYSLDGLNKMGDPFFVMEMVRTFIESSQKSLNILEEQIKTRDWEAVANEAHKLVASARHLEAYQLVDQLKKIELKATSSSPTISMNELERLTLCINELNNKLNQHIKAVRT